MLNTQGFMNNQQRRLPMKSQIDNDSSRKNRSIHKNLVDNSGDYGTTSIIKNNPNATGVQFSQSSSLMHGKLRGAGGGGTNYGSIDKHMAGMFGQSNSGSKQAFINQLPMQDF